MENLNLAFDIAEKHLDIPRMLDAEDMVNNVKPDELSVMAYVSSYYHAFSGAQKAETAANRICKVLKVNQENEKLMEDYERMASDLLAWIRRNTPWLEDRTVDNSLDSMKRKLDHFRDYRRAQKPPKIEEKAQLETTFNTLQTRLRLSNRPAYLPSEGKLVGDITGAWKGLERVEKGFEEWLLAELQRLERIEHLVKKFQQKCDNHQEWATGKLDMLEDLDYKRCALAHIKAMRNRHEAFESDLDSHQERVEEIAGIAEELNKLGYVHSSSVNVRCQSICDEWDKLGELTSRRRTGLDEASHILDNLDRLHLEFAKKASQMHTWLASTREDLTDMFIVHTLAEIQLLVVNHDEFKSTLPGAESGYAELQQLQKRITDICQSHGLTGDALQNPYTTVTASVLISTWQEVASLLPLRDTALQEEVLRQQNHERLRRQFADKANQVGPWLEGRIDAVQGIYASRLSLEQQLTTLTSMEEEVLAYRHNMDELERYNQAVQEAFVFDNAHTPYTMETLRVGSEQLLTSIARAMNEVENQILSRDSKGITTEQMDEFRRCFNHFDKNRKRQLEATEFKACLVSLGHNIGTDFSRIMFTVDPNNTGYVSFDAFFDYMTRETADTDTAEQIIQSFRILSGDLPYITAETLRRELPPDQAEYCVLRMAPYNAPDAVPGSLDYSTFSASLYGESDL